MLSKAIRPHFTVLSQSWYADSLIKNYRSRPNNEGFIDEVTIGINDEKGDTIGEFSLMWQRLGQHVAINLSMWDDSWNMFREMPELFSILKNLHGSSEENSIGVHSFVDILLGLGYIDCTARKAD